MAALDVGDPWDATTDVGPVIDAGARRLLDEHLMAGEKAKRTAG